MSAACTSIPPIQTSTAPAIAVGSAGDDTSSAAPAARRTAAGTQISAPLAHASMNRTWRRPSGTERSFEWLPSGRAP